MMGKRKKEPIRLAQTDVDATTVIVARILPPADCSITNSELALRSSFQIAGDDSGRLLTTEFSSPRL